MQRVHETDWKSAPKVFGGLIFRPEIGQISRPPKRRRTDFASGISLPAWDFGSDKASLHMWSRRCKSDLSRGQLPCPRGSLISRPGNGQLFCPFSGRETWPFSGPEIWPFSGRETWPFSGRKTWPFSGRETWPFSGRETWPFSGRKTSSVADRKLSVPRTGNQAAPRTGGLAFTKVSSKRKGPRNVREPFLCGPPAWNPRGGGEGVCHCD